MRLWLRRMGHRWWLWKHTTDALTRRVKVEKYLRDASRGVEPLPDEEKCKELALILGVPNNWWEK